MSTRSSVPRPVLARLWLAWAGGVLFIVLSAIQAISRPGYDSAQQSLSALSLGPFGWIQQLNFLVFGTLLFASAPAWRVLLSGAKGAGSYPVLTAISGISLILAGLVPQDPAPGYDPVGLNLAGPTVPGLAHIAIAGVAVMASTAGLLVLGRHFADNPNWRGWTMYCWACAILIVSCVAVYAVWSTSPTGFAGVFERLAVIPQLVSGVIVLLGSCSRYPIGPPNIPPGHDA